MKINKILSILLILSCAYLIGALIFFGYKKYYSPQHKSFNGEISTIGRIEEIGSNYLTIEFETNNQVKLSYNDKTTMMLTPQYQSIPFDKNKINKDDTAVVKYHTKGNILINITDFGPVSLTNQTRGKIEKIDDKQLIIRTWQENKLEQIYDLNDQVKYYDWTDLANKKETTRDKLKINDDINIEYDIKDKQNITKNIYLLKIGPEEK